MENCSLKHWFYMPIEKTSPDTQDSKSYHQVTFLPPLITNESKVVIKMRRACRVCAQIFAILIVIELLVTMETTGSTLTPGIGK